MYEDEYAGDYPTETATEDAQGVDQGEARARISKEARQGLVGIAFIVAALALVVGIIAAQDVDEWQRLDKEETCFLHKTQDVGFFGIGTEAEKLQTYCIGPDLKP